MKSALKEELENRKLTISELARRCKIDRSYLSKIINSEINKASERVLLSLSAELNLSMEEIKSLASIPKRAALEVVNNHFEKLEEILNTLDKGQITEAWDQIENAQALNVWWYPRLLEWKKGGQYTLEQKYEQGISEYLKAYNFTPRSSTERRFMGRIYGSLGGAYIALGDYKQGMQDLRQSLRFWPYGFQAAWVYMNMGTLYRRKRNYAKSLECFERCFTMGAPYVRLYAYTTASQIAIDREDLASARKYLLHAYTLTRKLTEPRGKGEIFCNLGKFYSLCGRIKKAKYWLNKAVDSSGLTGDLRPKHYALLELASIYLDEKNLSLYSEVMEVLQKEVQPGADCLFLGSQFIIKGKQALIDCNYDKATALLNECYMLLKDTAPSKELVDCCKLLSRCHRRKQEPTIAEFYCSEVERLKPLARGISIIYR